MFNRSLRSSLLDRNTLVRATFEPDATADAVVVVGAVAGVVYLLQVFAVGVALQFRLLEGLLSSVVSGLASWLLLAVATWFAGTRMFRGEAQMQTVMRTHGLVHLPLLLTAFAVGGTVGQLVALAGLVWFLAALVVATQVALNLSPRDAGLSVLVGYAILFLVGLLFRFPFLALQGVVG